MVLLVLVLVLVVRLLRRRRRGRRRLGVVVDAEGHRQLVGPAHVAVAPRRGDDRQKGRHALVALADEGAERGAVRPATVHQRGCEEEADEEEDHLG